jgi:ribosomal protein S18 acetylase RimI-like enzyme
MSRRQVPIRHVRPISPGDVDLVFDLHLQVFGVKAKRSVMNNAIFGEDSRAYYLQDGNTKEMLGFVLCWMLPSVVCVQQIGVRPDVQRLRIGSDLLNHVMQKADAAESSVKTHLPACNLAANRFFRRHGFKCCGIERWKYQVGAKKSDSYSFAWPVPEVPQ